VQTHRATATESLLAADLRVTVVELVRATRSVDALSPIPAAVLDLLDRDGPMTTADLAARRQVRHQSMAVTTKELLEVGSLEAAPHPVDGRKKVLNITDAGKRALNDDRDNRVKRLADAIKSTLSDNERLLLADALKLIDRITATISGDINDTTKGRGLVTGDW
jgi:DNA-binding MarR family transcriptional regulator